MRYLWLLLVLVLVPLASAIPEIPHQFYGSVSDSNGPVSGTLTAKLCGVDFSVDIINGNYGLNEPLLVARDDCSETNIEFYVSSYKAGDYAYESGAFTKLNFNVPVVSSGSSGSGGGSPVTAIAEVQKTEVPKIEEKKVEIKETEKENLASENEEKFKGITSIVGAVISGGLGSIKWVIIGICLIVVMGLGILLYKKWSGIQLTLLRYKLRR